MSDLIDKPSDKRWHSLTWRQSLRVITVALCVGLIICIFEIFLLFKITKEQLVSEQNQILDLAEPPTSEALWSLDEELADRTLQGLLSIETIYNNRIVSDDGSVFSEKTRTNQGDVERALPFKLFAEFETVTRPIHSPDKVQGHYGSGEIGMLVVNFDINKITHGFIDDIFVIIRSVFFNSIILSLVLAIVFHRFLTRPIIAIGQELSEISPDSSSLSSISAPQGHQTGELSFLVRQFNLMLSRLFKNHKELTKIATRDALTGLANRNLIFDKLRTNIEQAKEGGSEFAVIFIDLDRFKHINDSMGHSVGDKLLVHLADSLTENLPKGTFVGRLGGDEFVIVYKQAYKQHQSDELAPKLLSIINKPFAADSIIIHPAGSIGCAFYPKDGETVDSLVRNADLAMYQAKKQGTNCFVHYDPSFTADSENRFNIETKLKLALQNDDLLLFYQPKMDAETETLIGCEGLIRWNDKGNIRPPADFIDIAEEMHIIVPIGYWVIEQACKSIQRWRSMGMSIPVAINVSPIQLRESDFLVKVKEILSRYEGCTDLLEFEITESTLMTDIETTFSLFVQLRDNGIKISIDDFGTGYSSLSYLRRLPLDSLKIDRSFISDIPNDTVLPSTILALAKELHLTTVAEGVETDKQLAWLKENHCDIMQGYYFDKPLPISEFENKYIN
ncbi:EAL domain-containing protein [Alteromonadaceae bacterium M269]|nr:EAL domain-containing protein [Alteromonadaceae bacterium M269]